MAADTDHILVSSMMLLTRACAFLPQANSAWTGPAPHANNLYNSQLVRWGQAIPRLFALFLSALRKLVFLLPRRDPWATTNIHRRPMNRNEWSLPVHVCPPISMLSSFVESFGDRKDKLPDEEQTRHPSLINMPHRRNFQFKLAIIRNLFLCNFAVNALSERWPPFLHCGLSR
ncbi:hypothetical protein B0J18DRAFT_414591 [Chaetomium sp. MPI-SDFR-AT-0129]|nr:hypothetical protein B0J18DRAFT_414591 [Chaetomium sp. MPI-SDFR-AT-0129]